MSGTDPVPQPTAGSAPQDGDGQRATNGGPPGPRHLADWLSAIDQVDPQGDTSAGQTARTVGARTALANAVRELTALPSRCGTPPELLSRAAVACAQALGPTLHVSVTFGHPGHPELLGSSSSLAQTLDGIQVTAHEGPAVTAFEESRSVLSPDLSTDERWPLLGRALASQHPSALVVPIDIGDRLVGALHVYDPDPGRIDADEVDGALLLAATLGGLFLELELSGEVRRLNDDLRRSLASRAVIEQAKGIIMASKGCDSDAAFAHLVALSSSSERKVRDVAQQIVDSVPS